MSKEKDTTRKVPIDKKEISKRIPARDKEYIIEKVQRPEPWPDPPPEKEKDNED